MPCGSSHLSEGGWEEDDRRGERGNSQVYYLTSYHTEDMHLSDVANVWLMSGTYTVRVSNEGSANIISYHKLSI